MPKLTKDDLDKILEKQNFALPNSSSISRLYGLAAEVLIHFFGIDWVVNNVFGKRPLDEFLRARSSTREDRFKMTDRIVETAEILFNFQDIPGIENVIEKIKKNKVEPYVAELQSAKLLYSNKTPFFFNNPSNQKGLDYDLIITTENLEIPCEIECKIEDRNFSENTIRETLRHARKQLPKGKSSVIFVKIPEEWTLLETSQEQLLNVINEFFRRTTRINSIVYHWEEWDYFPTGEALRAVRFNEIVNPNSIVQLGRIMRKPEINQTSSNWIRFNDLIQNKFGDSAVTFPKPIKVIVLGNGFSWHSVLKILPQVSKGEHVFFDIGVLAGSRISFLIDSKNHIRFKVIDANLKKFEVTTNEPFFKIGLDNYSYLRFQIKPIFHYSELSINVNNKVVGRKTVLLHRGSILLPNITLGSDLTSQKKTAFEVAMVAIYEESSDKINTELTKHCNQEFALEIPI